MMILQRTGDARCLTRLRTSNSFERAHFTGVGRGRGLNYSRMAAADARVAPLILDWNEVWDALNTKSASFDACAKGRGKACQEFLSTLKLQREAHCVGKRTVTQDLIEGHKRYLNLLFGLQNKEIDWGRLSTEWTSPVSRRPMHWFRLQGLPQEQAMATLLLGAMMRNLAREKVLELTSSCNAAAAAGSHGSEGDVVLAKSTAGVTLLRSAAGAFKTLGEGLSLAVAATFTSSDRPLELNSAVAQCLQHLCLAEAQALTAFRAADKGSAYTTLATLHNGVVSCYEMSQRYCLEVETSVAMSERLSKLLSCSIKLHRARALVLHALDFAAKQEIGDAEKSCMDAVRLINEAVASTDNAEWKKVLRAVGDDAERLRVAYEKDRTTIFYEPLPPLTPPLPPGKVLVTPLEYVPEGVHLDWDAQEQGGCAVC